ncbi:YabP/YqfC family sporulation protein [Flintibacter sp.]
MAYGSEEIHISAGSYVVRVTGRELELRAMTGLELLITGQIADIRME